jgi:predicted TIM-barrel fold metal-dependent hydrolase
MPRRTLPMIDADGHVMEPAGMWERYIDPCFRDQAPRVRRGPDGRSTFESGGRQSPRVECVSAAMRAAFAGRVRESLAEALQAGYDPASQVRAMDQGGIEIAYLYPTQGLYVASVDDLDPELAIAICRAYNDWIVDFCAYAPDRLRPVAMLVGLHEPALAAREAERVADRGFAGVFLRPNPIRGRRLDDPAYEPLWAACERRGLAVGVHEGVGAHLPEAGADRFATFFACHSASHPLEQMLAMLALIGGGVLERHPRLRVAFLEAGCGWVPYWLWRLDEHWEKTREVAGEPQLGLPPSEYFRRQCWVSCEPDEPYIPRIIDFIGADRLLFASDYPHPDHRWPETAETMQALPLPRAVKQKIVWDNACAFYGVKG